MKQLVLEELEILSEFLASQDHVYELSEIQGLCLGVICTGRHKDMAYWQMQIEQTLLGEQLDSLPEDCIQVLQKLLQISFQDLTHPHFQLNLLLPEDNHPIESRLKALSDWCKGFVYGLGLGGPDAVIWNQPNIKEALADIAQIQTIELNSEETQDNEKNYIELVEYLKIATILIFEECSEILVLQGQSNHGLH